MAVRQAELGGRIVHGFALFRRQVAGLNEKEVPTGAILVHVKLTRRNTSHPVGFIPLGNVAKEGLLLPRHDSVDLDLAFHRLIVLGRSLLLCLGDCHACGEQ